MKIDIIDLSYAYPNGEAIFSHISFSISSGQIISILGPNGAGKTTLLNCIAMLHTPSAGEIRIDGRDARKMKPRDVAQCVRRAWARSKSPKRNTTSWPGKPSSRWGFSI